MPDVFVFVLMFVEVMTNIEMVLPCFVLLVWIILPKSMIVNFIASCLGLLALFCPLFCSMSIVFGSCLDHFITYRLDCLEACLRERLSRFMLALDLTEYDCAACLPPPPTVHPIAAMIADGYWH